MDDWLVALSRFEGGLAETGETYWTGLRHGTMSAGLYAPSGSDPQRPHDQDELYIVLRGRGNFSKAGEIRPFGPGDVIFVDAGAEHRFEDFSDDFAAWVVFWGPKGGEPQED